MLLLNYSIFWCVCVVMHVCIPWFMILLWIPSSQLQEKHAVYLKRSWKIYDKKQQALVSVCGIVQFICTCFIHTKPFWFMNHLETFQSWHEPKAVINEQIENTDCRIAFSAFSISNVFVSFCVTDVSMRQRAKDVHYLQRMKNRFLLKTGTQNNMQPHYRPQNPI